MPNQTDDDWVLHVETARVELWRGYLTARFVARSSDDGAAVTAESTAFRWRSSKAPDTEEARLAHYELVGRLKAEGWSPSGDGGEWYETELNRPTMVPRTVEEKPPEQAVVVPAPAPVLPPPLPVEVIADATPAPSRFEPPRLVEVHEDADTQVAPRDPWRVVASVGLVLALAFLVALLLH